MVKLYILLAVSIALAWLYENSYVHTRIGPRRPEFIYVILVAILICFNGFRGSYNDTWTYRDSYTYLVQGFPEGWDDITWNLGSNPGFRLIETWLKTYNTDVHLFLMFFAFWTVLFYMLFLKRHSTKFVFSIYLFFTMGCYVFTLAAIKQCMATAICLLALPYAIDKKWTPYIGLVLLSSLFHPYSLMYLIVPFMFFKPWGKTSYVLLFGIIALGLLLQPLLGTVIDITTAIGENYTEDTFAGKGIGVPRILVCWTPVFISFFYRKELFEHSTREQNLFVNLSMVYAGIIFVGMFGTALYFGRLSYYFNMMPVIALPWMLSKISHKNRQLLTTIAVPCYFLFFYYTYTLENHFDTAYEALTLSQFLGYLIDAFRGAAG